jgi:hypothetical protein
MTRLKLHLLVLEPSHDGSHAYAELAWTCEGQSYPSADWIDNAETVLSWWLGVLMNFARGRRGQSLAFMEGPYEVRLRPVAGCPADVELIARDSPWTCRVPFTDLVNEVLHASAKLRHDVRTWRPSPVNRPGFLAAERELRTLVFGD